MNETKTHTDLIIYFAEHNIYRNCAYNKNLNIIADNVALANALSDVEPENDLHANKGVKGGLLDGLVPPGTSLSTGQQFANASLDLWDFTQFRRRQLHSRILQEDIEFGASSCDSG